VLAGTMAFALLASLVFGAFPAWHLTGRAVAREARGGEDTRLPAGIRIGNALMVAQVAFSLVLLASGGLFLTSAIRAAAADPGFRVEDGVLAEIDPGLTGYDDTQARRFHLELADRLRAIAGVESITLGSGFPFTGMGHSRGVVSAALAAADATPVDARFLAVGRDYARTLGFAMLQGRDFTDAELTSGGSERVAIVDDALAERLWPNQSPLDHLIRFVDEEGPASGTPLRIVGLVPAIKHSLGNPQPFPHVYVPLGHHDQSALTLQLRVARGQDGTAMLATVASVVRNLDARVPVLRLQTWREHLDASIEMWLYRAGAWVCSAFGTLALLLAVIGVYGVKSYLVSRRVREFGIRIAVGAQPRTLWWQVLRDGGRVTAAGLVLGGFLALGAGQLLQSVLHGVNSVEPLVLLTAPAILLAAALLASLIPALRATKVNPTVALRSE
jgi:predicted permease